MRRPVEADLEPGPKTVLVVDDEASLRLLCRVNLELDGHRVLEAPTVAAARATLTSEDVDVVLLDVHVADESGLDLLDDIEALGLPARVVMLSGTSEISPQVRARIDGVLGKPFELGDLASAVRGEASGRLPRL
jgi:DNA-binding NtrC family response regulator